MPPSIDIVLGTYNGERFLAEQLRSLEEQTVSSWRLVARDDGSADNTRSILAEFRGRHRDRVTLIEDGKSRLGPCRNYGLLMEHSTADYTFFCDQDDVWRPEKIEVLQALATRGGAGEQPQLLHTDLEVVDIRLQPVAPSFWRYQHLAPERCGWPQLLVQNVVTGCAAAINAPLRRAALPVPREAIMHDWWVALVAATSGTIHWSDRSTVRYRQHGANDTGAKRFGLNQWHYTIDALVRPARYRAGVAQARCQAAALARHTSAPIAAPIRDVLAQFGALDALPYPRRVAFQRRHQIAKNGWLRNLVFLRNI